MGGDAAWEIDISYSSSKPKLALAGVAGWLGVLLGVGHSTVGQSKIEREKPQKNKKRVETSHRGHESVRAPCP